MIKKLTLSLIFVLLLSLSGCEKQNDTATKLSYNSASYTVADYVDPETGVHYLMFKWGYGVSVLPRYNSDGSIMVEEGEAE